MRRRDGIALIVVVGAAAGVAPAQYDPAAWWADFKGGPARQASKAVPAGPATEVAWMNEDLQPTALGGFSVDADGFIYFKTRSDQGFQQVFKLDPSDGAVVATSPDLVGDTRSYGGVTIGVDAIYATASTSDDGSGSPLSTIYKLDKTDLSIIDAFTNPAEFDDLAGVRSQPILSSFVKPTTGVNMYVYERGSDGIAGLIHAVDSVTGDIDWTYDPLLTQETFFSQVGPSFEVDGQTHIAYFSRDSVDTGILVRDNNDGTNTELWFGGPQSFNWFGSGVLSSDGSLIYVTTFNDNDAPSLWAINADTGAVEWSVPGQRGTVTEFNFFGRPAVAGDRVYAGGQQGLITCFEPDGSGGFTQPWEIRAQLLDDNGDTVPDAPGDTKDAYPTLEEFFNGGEITSLAVAQVDSDGDTVEDERYVYASMQEQFQDPDNPLPEVTTQLIVVRDDGASAEVVLRTTLDDELKPTRWGAGSPTILPDGSILIAGGNVSVTGSANGQVVKLSPASDCPADLNDDDELNFFDVSLFLQLFNANDPQADFNDDDEFNFFDVSLFLQLFNAGC